MPKSRIFEYKNHSTMKKNRLKVLTENNFTCKYCGGKATEIHHIDGSKNNHAPENLIPVCHKCHMKIHWPKIKEPRWDIEMIKVAMMQRGIDKGELAKKVDLTKTSLSVILKTGKTKNSTMKKIADALNYPLEVFFTPSFAAKLEQLEIRARTISPIKAAIETKLKTIKDSELHKRFHIWLVKDLKQYLQVNSYFDIPEDQINEAIEFINKWKIPETTPTPASCLDATGTG